MDNLYQRLLDHFGGRPSAVAAALGVKPQVVSNWRKRGFPPERALEIEEVTRGRIKAKEVLQEQRPQ